MAAVCSRTSAMVERRTVRMKGTGSGLPGVLMGAELLTGAGCGISEGRAREGKGRTRLGRGGRMMCGGSM